MASKKIRLDADVLEDPNVSSLSANNTITSNNNSGGPFRGRYSRPLGGGSLSASTRFSPYSISRDRPSNRRSVPIIRARREDSGSVSSFDLNTSANTSSTAQKIIETLASMSTPVLNAGRVRIDSIKTVKPLLSGVPAFSSGSMLAPSSKFNGPPKTASPLMLPIYATGNRPASLDSSSNWLLKSLNVPPKMVDSGTNTDEPMNNKSEDSLSETLLPPVAVDNSSSVVVVPFIAGNGLKGPENGVASEEFSFSDPWPLTELDELVGDRHSTAGEEVSSASSSSEDDEENENSNEEESLANGDVNDGEKGSTKEVSGSKISSSYAMSISANQKKWECPSCMVFNEQKDSECVCCATKNPSSTASSSSVSVSTAKKWDCPECMVPNQSTAAACVCCTTPNPNNKITAAEKKPAEKWTCPTCMVPNEATSNACVCCTEPNPNPVSSDGDKSKSLTSTASALPPTSTFKFGFSSSTPASTSATNTGFTFGAPSTSSSTPSPSSFKFGVPATTAISGSGSKSQPTTTTTSSSISSGFTFGAPASKSPASTIPIKFGSISSVSKTETGTSQKQAEVWKCDICPGKNKMESINCATCNSPRPQDFDANYVAPPEKPKNNSRFEPHVGTPKSTAPSTVPVPPIKSGVSLFSSSTSQLSTAQPVPSVSSGPSITSGIGSGFGSGTTFSSGNPFGTGVAAFGSSSSGSSFGSSIGSGTTFGTLAPVTTTTTPSGFSSGLPSFSSPGVSNPPERQGFQFVSGTASSPTKRKLEDGSDGGDPAKKISHSLAPSFAFGSSSDTASSFSAFPTSAPPAQIGITPGGSNPPAFLEALKNASAAVKASSEKQSNTVTSTSGPANKGFQFSVAPTTTTSVSNSGTFGMTNPALAPAPTFTFGSGAPAPTFGSSAGGGGFQNNSGQIFGSMGSASGMGQSQPSAAAPATPQFVMNPTNFNFGSPAPPSTTTFTFGAPGGPAGQPSASPAPLFQFAAASSPGPAGEQRKIRRATRRFPRN